MISNHIIAFLILFIVQIAGVKTGVEMILHKDIMWHAYLRNARLNPKHYIKPALWNPALNSAGIFLVVGSLLLFTTSVQAFWA